jgi:hypothetical protein
MVTVSQLILLTVNLGVIHLLYTEQFAMWLLPLLERESPSWALACLSYFLLPVLTSGYVSLSSLGVVRERFSQRKGRTYCWLPLYAKSKKVVPASLETALGIVPPDEVW